MRTIIKINPLAVSDLQEIKTYIAEDSAETAEKVINEIIEKIELLASYPEIGINLKTKLKISTSYKFLVCNNHIIFYIFSDDTVFVQRILHARRDYLRILQESESQSNIINEKETGYMLSP